MARKAVAARKAEALLDAASRGSGRVFHRELPFQAGPKPSLEEVAQ